MPHEIAAFRRSEARQRGGDELTNLIKGPRPCGAQKGFQFGEGLFNGIEIGTVRRQESQCGADGFDGLAHGGLLVEGEIVEHDDGARTKRRHEDLLDVREEGGIVEGAVEDRGGRQAIGRQRRDHRVQVPLTAGREVAETLPARAATITAQQVGGHPAFVEKDVAARIADSLAELPAAPRRRDVRTSLFGGVYRFF